LLHNSSPASDRFAILIAVRLVVPKSMIEAKVE
jgi:hypothetical protein